MDKRAQIEVEDASALGPIGDLDLKGVGKLVAALCATGTGENEGEGGRSKGSVTVNT